MSTALAHIGFKIRPIRFQITINYYASRVLYLLIKPLEKVNQTLKGLLESNIDKLTSIMKKLYGIAENLDAKKAEDLYPDIVDIQKFLYKQDKKLANIDYFLDVRKNLRYLIRLTNRTEARLHTAIFKNAPSIQTREHLKGGLISHNHKIIVNALREKANH